MTDDLQAIDRALDANDIPAAAAIAERLLARGHTEPIVFNLVAWRREEDARYDEAEALLLQALALAPDDATLHVGLGVVRRKAGRLREAVQAFEQAIALDADYATAWHERGATFELGGAIADAMADFERASALDPDHAPSHAALAGLHARRGEAELAQTRAQRALSLDPGNLAARNALAQQAIEARRFADAVALLEPLAATDDATERETRVSSLTLLGDAYEGLGRHDDAYASYARAQALFHAIHTPRLDPAFRDHTGFLAAIGESLRQADAADWRNTPDEPLPGEATTHVFLTGYPRSGTTLAENILASLPGAVAVEERPTLAAADQRFLSDPHGMTRLSRLPSSELAELRADYWARAARAADQPLPGRLFIDMDPFKGYRLPIIAKLFPRAKVIVMRRDPRDVVWSCFHTHFRFNAGTMAFTSLEATARHYAAAWQITETALETLPLDWFELRYDALVSGFDGTTQALCRFLGVPWDEGMRQFDRTARARGVSTASATQVRRGLYDGTGGWRRYASQMAPLRPILDPWIKRFGFAEW